MHENARTASPHMRLHGEDACRSAQDPSVAAQLVQSRANTHGNVCFLLILKNDCFNDRLKTWSIQMAAMNAKAKNSMLRRGQGRET